jgi:hypothetical protein
VAKHPPEDETSTPPDDFPNLIGTSNGPPKYHDGKGTLKTRTSLTLKVDGEASCSKMMTMRNICRHNERNIRRPPSHLEEPTNEQLHNRRRGRPTGTPPYHKRRPKANHSYEPSVLPTMNTDDHHNPTSHTPKVVSPQMATQRLQVKLDPKRCRLQGGRDTKRCRRRSSKGGKGFHPGTSRVT